MHVWSRSEGLNKLQKNLLYSFSGSQTHFGMPRGAKMSLTPMNRYRMFFIQTFTSTQNLHWKPTEHGKFSKQNTQLPTKTPTELKDNSIAALKFRQLQYGLTSSF
jgi:hypothetical protein